jgi:hypothetical protein
MPPASARRAWGQVGDAEPGDLVLHGAPMTTSNAVADVQSKTVAFEGTTYRIQELGQDTYTVLVEGVPVGRIVYTFGAANGVPEGEGASEDTLYAIAEAWFAAIEA